MQCRVAIWATDYWLLYQIVSAFIKMSSGSWELVSRKKDKNDKSNKLTKAEKKKFIENAPKVEDFCESHFFALAFREDCFTQLAHRFSTTESDKDTV